VSEPHYDAIVIGSGAGGGAAAYKLAGLGRRVLVLEKGEYLPRDGSTLDVVQVLEPGRFKSKECWLDNQGRDFTPDEYHNVGGKTKWYGAALLRFSPEEFQPDPAYQALPWPITYDELLPYYEEAENIMNVSCFDNEPDLQGLINRLVKKCPDWRAQRLPLGLKRAILGDTQVCRRARDAKRDVQVSVSPCAGDSYWAPAALRPSPHRTSSLGSPPRRLPQRLYGVSVALAYALRVFENCAPFDTPVIRPRPTPTGDYPPRASHFLGGQRW